MSGSNGGAPATARTYEIHIEAIAATGLLERIAGVLRRRGCAISRVEFDQDADAGTARLTAAVQARDGALLAAQLRRLEDVRAVTFFEFTTENT